MGELCAWVSVRERVRAWKLLFSSLIELHGAYFLYHTYFPGIRSQQHCLQESLLGCIGSGVTVVPPVGMPLDRPIGSLMKAINLLPLVLVGARAIAVLSWC